MRSLNVKLLAVALLALGMLGVGIHFLHAFQVRRNASSLKAQAHREKNLAKEGKTEAERKHLEMAAVYLDRYMRLEPNDTESLVEYVNLRDETASNIRQVFTVLDLFEKVLRNDPEQREIRRKAVTRCMQLHRWADAIDHLNVLIDDRWFYDALEDRGQFHGLKGECVESLGQHQAAVKELEQAIYLNPDRLESYTLLAMIQRGRLAAPDEADETMSTMVLANRKTPLKAILTHFGYLDRFFPENADKATKEKWSAVMARDVDVALRLDPEDAEALLAGVVLAQREKDAKKQRAHLESGARVHWEDLRFYYQLSQLELAEGGDDKYAKASKWLQVYIAKNPTKPFVAEARMQLGELLIASGRLVEAVDELKKLDELQENPEAEIRSAYLRARIEFAKENWRQAVRQIETVRPSLSSSSDLERAANYLLSQCYERLGEPDMRLAAARRAFELAPLRFDGQFALATSLAVSGHSAEALPIFRRLAASEKSLNLQVAQLLSVRLQSRPGADPESPQVKAGWSDVEECLKKADDAFTKEGDKDKAAIGRVLGMATRADALAAQGRFQEAETELGKARRDYPERIEIPIGQANLAARQNNCGNALEILNGARSDERLKGHYELYVALARLWGASFAKANGEAEKAKAHSELDDLKKYAESFSAEDQATYLANLAEIHERYGLPGKGESLWKELAAKQKANLKCRLVLFDAALRAKDKETADELIDEIRRIEGEDGTWWRFCKSAALLSWDKAKHDEAMRILAEAAERRPNWPRIPRLQAEVADGNGKVDQAIEYYQRAFDLGDRHSRTMERLAELLEKKMRFQEAESVYRRVIEEDGMTANLGKMATQSALMMGDPKGALEIAERTAAASSDYRDHLWLARILPLPKEKEKVEKALNRAAELADHKKLDAPELLVARIAFYSALKDTDAGKTKEKLLKKAEATFADRKNWIILANCYEAAGDHDKAERQFDAAVAANPKDVAVMQAAVMHYMAKGKLKEADPLLAELLSFSNLSDSELAWARRNQALVLASYKGTDEALKLIEQNLDARSDSAEDLRVKAMIRAADPETMGEAIRLLDQLRDRGVLSIEDQFTLAQLYDVKKEWPKAREHMEQLLGSVHNNPAGASYVAAFVKGLLKHAVNEDAEELKQAELWQAWLERNQAGALVTLEMRVQILRTRAELAGAAAATDRYGILKQEAAALIMKRAGEKDPPLQTLAALLESLDDKDQKYGKAEAEKLLKRLRDNPDKPEDMLQLALFYGREKKTNDAMDACWIALKKCPPESVALVLVAVLRSTDSTDDQRKTVEDWLRSAIVGAGSPVPLLANLAELLDLRGKFDESEMVWGQVLEKNRDHIIALNNLSCLLSYRHATGRKGMEAVALIDRALKITGPVPELLDSRAMAYLNAGNAAEAIASLDKAVKTNPSAAKFYHLALAYDKANNSKSAKDSMNKARDLRLTEKDLHPQEIDGYRKFVTKY